MRPPNVIRHDRLGPLTIPLHGLHSMALSYGEDQFKRKGCCPPTFLLAVGTDVVWVEERWESSDERGFHFYMMRQVLEVLSARAYSFISEVYVAKASSEEEMQEKARMELWRLPKEERDEMLWVDTWSREGQHYASNYLITPRKHGLAFLGPRIDEAYKDHDEFTGRAVNLFKPPRERPS